MAPIKSVTTLMSFLTTTFALQYQLMQNYNASNIFEEFDFFSVGSTVNIQVSG